MARGCVAGSICNCGLAAGKNEFSIRCGVQCLFRRGTAIALPDDHVALSQRPFQLPSSGGTGRGRGSAAIGRSGRERTEKYVQGTGLENALIRTGTDPTLEVRLALVAPIG